MAKQTSLSAIKARLDRVESQLVYMKERDPEEYRLWLQIVEELKANYRQLLQMERGTK